MINFIMLILESSDNILQLKLCQCPGCPHLVTLLLHTCLTLLDV